MTTTIPDVPAPTHINSGDKIFEDLMQDPALGRPFVDKLVGIINRSTTFQAEVHAADLGGFHVKRGVYHGKDKYYSGIEPGRTDIYIADPAAYQKYEGSYPDPSRPNVTPDLFDNLGAAVQTTPEAIFAGILAHKLGHALDKNVRFGAPLAAVFGSSDWNLKELSSEGIAAVSNAVIAKEVHEHGGPTLAFRGGLTYSDIGKNFRKLVDPSLSYASSVAEGASVFAFMPRKYGGKTYGEEYLGDALGDGDKFELYFDKDSIAHARIYKNGAPSKSIDGSSPNYAPESQTDVGASPGSAAHFGANSSTTLKYPTASAYSSSGWGRTAWDSALAGGWKLDKGGTADTANMVNVVGASFCGTLRTDKLPTSLFSAAIYDPVGSGVGGEGMPTDSMGLHSIFAEPDRLANVLDPLGSTGTDAIPDLGVGSALGIDRVHGTRGGVSMLSSFAAHNAIGAPPSPFRKSYTAEALGLGASSAPRPETLGGWPSGLLPVVDMADEDGGSNAGPAVPPVVTMPYGVASAPEASAQPSAAPATATASTGPMTLSIDDRTLGRWVRDYIDRASSGPSTGSQRPDPGLRLMPGAFRGSY